MNERGQMGVAIYGIMLGVIIMILAFALAPAGQESVATAMNGTVGDVIGLDCSNTSISNFDKGTCIITDFSFPYFFGGLILIGGAIMTARIIFS